MMTDEVSQIVCDLVESTGTPLGTTASVIVVHSVARTFCVSTRIDFCKLKARIPQTAQTDSASRQVVNFSPRSHMLALI
jgi:hypothetical protein